jgi:hypothetical protein
MPDTYNKTDSDQATCIKLMLLFFFVELVSDALVARGILSVKIASPIAHDSFIAFFGVTLGIFRGKAVEHPLQPTPTKEQQ